MPLPNTVVTAYVVYGDDEKAPFVNVLHYFLEEEADVDTTDAVGLAEALDASIGPALKACMPEDARYIKCVVKISQVGLAYEGESGGEGGPGLLADDSLPQGVAVVIRKRTAVGGRRGRGRWFIGCISEEDNDSGRLEPASFARWDVLATAMSNDQAVGGKSYKAAHLSRADMTLVPIVSVSVQHVFQRQSRRKLQPTI